MRKPCRSRLVVFRLDADEYKALEMAQRKSRARNISDYCRASILSGIEAGKMLAGFSAEDIAELESERRTEASR